MVPQAFVAQQAGDQHKGRSFRHLINLSTSLNSGVPASASHSNRTISPVAISTPLARSRSPAACRLAGWRELQLPRYGPARPETDPAALEKLRSLGYVD